MNKTTKRIKQRPRMILLSERALAGIDGGKEDAGIHAPPISDVPLITGPVPDVVQA
jgi:hypothetical protein